MKRTFWQRIRVMVLFVRSSEHEKNPRAKRLMSIRWWIIAWSDAGVLGT